MTYAYAAKSASDTDDQPPDWPGGWEFPPDNPRVPPGVEPNAYFFCHITASGAVTFDPTFTTAVETLTMYFWVLEGGEPYQGNAFSVNIAAGSRWPYIIANEVTKITELDIQDDSIDRLYPEQLTGLITLNARTSALLTTVDLSANTALETVRFANTGFASIDLTANTALVTLELTNSAITALDVSTLVVLETLNVPTNTGLAALDVTNNTALDQLACGGCAISTLDVTLNTAMTSLSVYSNLLTTIDISNNTALTLLWIWSNPLTGLDISTNVLLTDVRCNDCGLNQATVDGVLSDLVAAGLSGGTLRIQNNVAPSGAGAADAATLVSRGWAVMTD